MLHQNSCHATNSISNVPQSPEYPLTGGGLLYPCMSCCSVGGIQLHLCVSYCFTKCECRGFRLNHSPEMQGSLNPFLLCRFPRWILHLAQAYEWNSPSETWIVTEACLQVINRPIKTIHLNQLGFKVTFVARHSTVLGAGLCTQQPAKWTP